ncbi:hypothetical protein ACHAPX_005272 [Trichoderma viride]
MDPPALDQMQIKCLPSLDGFARSAALESYRAGLIGRPRRVFSMYLLASEAVLRYLVNTAMARPAEARSTRRKKAIEMEQSPRN